MAPQMGWFHHARGFCYNKLFRYPCWSFPVHAVLRYNWIVFYAPMHEEMSTNSGFFLFSSFSLNPQNLSTLHPGFFGNLLMYCLCAIQMWKMNMSEMENAFLQKCQKWNSRNLCPSSPVRIPIFPHRWGGSTMHSASVTTNSFDIHELSFPHACSIRLQVNCVFWANAPMVFHVTLGFFFLFSSFPLCPQHLSTLPADCLDKPHSIDIAVH